MNKTRILALTVACIGLSVIGAFIKIPAVIGSVALDSAPALVAAVLLGPFLGGAVGAAGHIVSAMLSGFPLGPAHLLIGIEMFFLVAGFGFLAQKKQKAMAFLFFFVGNAIVAPLPFIWMMGMPFYIGIVPSLLIAAAVNLIIAALVSPRLMKLFDKQRTDEQFYA
jgi:uncharacterized membrane protein